MYRAGMIALQRLVDAKKFGIFITYSRIRR
jgi:hypothetical protein